MRDYYGMKGEVMKKLLIALSALLIPCVALAAPPTQDQLNRAEACTEALARSSIDLRKYVFAVRAILVNPELSIPSSTETVTIPEVQLNRVVDVQEYQRRKARVSDAFQECP